MTCITVPIQNASAQLDELLVNGIQSHLAANVAWLEKVFNIASISEMRKDDGAIERYPRVYAGVGEYIDVRPDDSVKAISFFERNGEIEFDFISDPSYTIPLGLVVWVNLGKIDPGSTFDFTSQLAAEVLGELDSFLSGQVEILSVDLRSEQALSRYTLPEIDSKYLSHPFNAFRISMRVTSYGDPRCAGAYVPVGGTEC